MWGRGFLNGCYAALDGVFYGGACVLGLLWAFASVARHEVGVAPEERQEEAAKEGGGGGADGGGELEAEIQPLIEDTLPVKPKSLGQKLFKGVCVSAVGAFVAGLAASSSGISKNFVPANENVAIALKKQSARSEAKEVRGSVVKGLKSVLTDRTNAA